MCTHCAHAVRKVGYFRPVFPMAKVTAVTTAQIFTQSQISDNELNQPMLHMLHADPVDGAAQVVCGFQGSHRKAKLLLGTVQKRPHTRTCVEHLCVCTSRTVIARTEMRFSGSQ